MFVDPKIVVEKGYLTGEIPLDEDQIQPNGIDCRIKSITKIDINSVFSILSNDEKCHAARSVTEENTDRCFCGSPGAAYLMDFYEYVKIPENLVGLVYGRSSLNRSGLLFRSSVYDSGYTGYIGGLLLPFSNFTFFKGARVAQIVFAEARASKLYDGSWNCRLDKVVEER